MKIAITGDTHGGVDGNQLFTIPKCDLILVLGDFGFLWRHGDLPKFPDSMKVAFIDGNHENFNYLESFPQVQYFGGKARQITPNCFHLMRGEIYDIYGKKFLCIGGASSIDKAYRNVGTSWWPQEDITGGEIQNTFNNLDVHKWKVDYVLTHTIPQCIISKLGGVVDFGIQDPTSRFLDELYINKKLRYTKWYAGHWHMSQTVGKVKLMFKDWEMIDAS